MNQLGQELPGKLFDDGDGGRGQGEKIHHFVILGSRVQQVPEPRGVSRVSRLPVGSAQLGKHAKLPSLVLLSSRLKIPS